MKDLSSDDLSVSGAGVLTAPSPTIDDVLNPRATQRPLGRKRLLLLLAGALAVCAAAAFLFLQSGAKQTTYLTAAVTRGPLVRTVTATGQLETRTKVEIGSEVSGTIEEVLVDFNDPVEKDQIIARLDTEKLEAQAAESRAAFASAQARLVQANANRAEAKSKLDRLRKVHELSGGKMPSLDELDSADASLKRTDAEIAAADAAIAQAQAQLRVHETNLTKAVIRSPITGVVLERRVEPGQTVAASFQAPVLFTIAEDLRQLSLHVKVDEADVGKVAVGQEAEFQVDAYPDKKFQATISQVRYAPLNEAGVVTYQTLLSVENDQLLLRPGMTATADIVIERLEDALLVPNAALRFAPPAPAVRPRSSGGLMGSMFGRGRWRRDDARKPRERPARVWQESPDGPIAVTVSTGASDGEQTQLLGTSLSAGEEVIIGSEGE